MDRKFTDVKVGDIIICYDVYSMPDYEEHRFKVTDIYYDREYRKRNNPKGMYLFGEDLDYPEESEYYMFVAYYENFVRFAD